MQGQDKALIFQVCPDIDDLDFIIHPEIFPGQTGGNDADELSKGIGSVIVGII